MSDHKPHATHPHNAPDILDALSQYHALVRLDGASVDTIIRARCAAAPILAVLFIKRMAHGVQRRF